MDCFPFIRMLTFRGQTFRVIIFDMQGTYLASFDEERKIYSKKNRIVKKNEFEKEIDKLTNIEN